MSTLIARIVNNPVLLLWIAGICFIAGLASGGSSAWWLQGLRLDALQGKYDTFVARTESLGKQAQAKAEAQELVDKLDKEKRDEELQKALTDNTALNKQLRNERNSSRGTVPQVRGTSADPERACLRRAELNTAIQRYFAGRGTRDNRVWDLITKGDDSRIALDAAKKKVQGIR